MGTMAAAYWSDQEWYDHYTRILPDIKKALADPNLCIDTICQDTNWGGINRLHGRSETCPAYDLAYLLEKHNSIIIWMGRYERNL